MRTHTIILGVAMALTFVSCNKENLSVVNFDAIVGAYEGTLSNESTSQSDPAQVTVTKANDEAVYVHCFSSYMDTTFMLNVYENGNLTMVCHSGDAFTNEYGPASGHSMMHDFDGSGWEHHMEEEHEGSDQHYGSFNMTEHAFNYTFSMTDNGPAYSILFNGYLQ